MKMTPNKEGYLKVNNIEIYYISYGSGEPIIILHGGPGFDHRHMLPFQKLSDNFEVVFYDQRASGNSSGKVDSTSITINNFVEDLEALRISLGIDNIILLGHSWGSVLGQFYAIKYPEHLKAMILLSAYASSDLFGEYFSNINKRTIKEDMDIIKQIEASDDFKSYNQETMQNYFKLSVKPFFHDVNKLELLDFTFGKNTAKSVLEIGNLLLKDVSNFDIHDKLSIIKCPVLVIHGDSDPLPEKAALKVCKAIPNAKYINIKDTGHFMFVEKQEECLNCIIEFLQGLKV